jgi:hypothetical protein
MVNVGQYSGLQHPPKANFVFEHNDNFERISLASRAFASMSKADTKLVLLNVRF